MVRTFPGHGDRAGAWVASLYGLVQREITLWAGSTGCYAVLWRTALFLCQLVCHPLLEPHQDHGVLLGSGFDVAGR